MILPFSRGLRFWILVMSCWNKPGTTLCLISVQALPPFPASLLCVQSFTPLCFTGWGHLANRTAGWSHLLDAVTQLIQKDRRGGLHQWKGGWIIEWTRRFLIWTSSYITKFPIKQRINCMQSKNQWTWKKLKNTPVLIHSFLLSSPSNRYVVVADKLLRSKSHLDQCGKSAISALRWL